LGVEGERELAALERRKSGRGGPEALRESGRAGGGELIELGAVTLEGVRGHTSAAALEREHRALGIPRVNTRDSGTGRQIRSQAQPSLAIVAVELRAIELVGGAERAA
jgi:hypothetical protein